VAGGGDGPSLASAEGLESEGGEVTMLFLFRLDRAKLIADCSNSPCSSANRHLSFLTALSVGSA